MRLAETAIVIILALLAGSQCARAGTGRALDFDGELLHQAEVGNAAKIEELIREGANVDARDESGATPLMLAASKGHEGAVQVLLRSGAVVSLRSTVMDAPVLSWAVSSCNLSIIRSLLAAGAEVNAHTDDGTTPLIDASRTCSTEILKTLVEAGANPIAWNDSGETPLSRAHSSTANFQYLLKECSQIGISEISLQRTVCPGNVCPEYQIVLRLDGTAEYEGFEHVERKGKYLGKVGITDFLRLANLADTISFASLNEKYSIPWTCQSYAITSITKGGQIKIVSDYGGGGPIELWGLEMAIDGLVSNIKWEKTPDSPPTTP